jgi:hypothetical protein
VLEEIINALALHPARDEIKVALPILADMILGAVALEAHFKVAAREAVVREDGLDHVGQRLFREHAAVL